MVLRVIRVPNDPVTSVLNNISIIIPHGSTATAYVNCDVIESFSSRDVDVDVDVDVNVRIILITSHVCASFTPIYSGYVRWIRTK